MTRELAAEKGLTVDEKGFADHFAAHQKLSQAGAEQRFKGGLADHSAQTARLHTATHLLQAALRRVRAASESSLLSGAVPPSSADPTTPTWV